MKHGKFWMTTVGAGLAIAGMMTVSHAAMQNSAFLFLAGQMKVAAGYTESGMQLMHQAASKRDLEEGKVYAAERQTAKPTEVCTKNNSAKPVARPATVPQARVRVSFQQAPRPVAVLAKLDVPPPAFTPEVGIPSQITVDPANYQYLSDAQRQQVLQVQADFQRIRHERMKELRRGNRVIIRYAPAAQGFNPADMSNMERELPAMLGQMAQ